MTQVQKTEVVAKPAKAKPVAAGKKAEVKDKATKPAQAQAPKQAQEPKTPFCKALYIAVLAGQFGNLAKAYYQRADEYHKKQKTIFPRARTSDARAAMDKKTAQEIIAMAAKGILASGNAKGQALYDLMKTGADLAK